MENFNFEKIIQMAQEGNRAELTTLPPESLVEAIIKLSNRAIYENADRYISKQLEAAESVISTNDLTNVSIYIDRIHDMERQLSETEKERDHLQGEKEGLEKALQSAQADAARLEKELAAVPKAGRPDKYDAEFRAKVRAYYEEGHTYRETAKHFNISTNTVGRFLNECRYKHGVASTASHIV